MAKKQYLSLGGLETYDEQIKAYIDGVKNNVQPKDFVATITSKFENNSIVYTCDTSSADLWAAHEAGRNVIFNLNNLGFIDAEFIITASQGDSEVKQVRTILSNGATAQLYIVHEDDSVNVTNYSFLTTANVKQETGTSQKLPMSQKAVTDALASKSDASHTHDDIYYTEAEIDAKLSTVNTSISNITSGSTPVKEAEHATSADSATNATHATSADSATSATSATKATQDGNGKEISSTYETKDDATAKLAEAKSHADSAASTAATAVKNDLLNGAGAAYDTLKELGDLIDDNKDAIEVLEDVAAGKADATHSHAIADVTGLQTALDAKAAQTSLDSHTGNTTVHITATERTNWNAAKTHADSAHAPSNAQANVIETIKVNGSALTPASKAVDITIPTDYLVAADIANKADKATTLSGYGITNAYTKTEVDTELATKATTSALDSVSSVANEAKAATAANTQSITANTSSINTHTSQISALQGLVGDGFEEITTAEIQALFSA